MSLLSMLPDLGTLQRAASTKDTSAGEQLSWANVAGAVDVPHALQPMAAEIRKQYTQLSPAQAWTAFLSQDLGPFITPTVGALPMHRWAVTTATGSVRYFKLKGFGKAAPSFAEWPCEMHLEEQPGA